MTLDSTASELPLTEEEWAYLCNRRFQLRVRTLSNRLYQQERQRIMERREGTVKASSLIFGSVALARVVPEWAMPYCLSIIFLGTAGSLVFGWGNKARDAAKRAAEWIAIDRDMDEVGDRTFTEQQLNQWSARCNEVEAGEPAAHPMLWEQSYRRACEALGSTPTEPTAKVRMGWRPVLLIP